MILFSSFKCGFKLGPSEKPTSDPTQSPTGMPSLSSKPTYIDKIAIPMSQYVLSLTFEANRSLALRYVVKAGLNVFTVMS